MKSGKETDFGDDTRTEEIVSLVVSGAIKPVIDKAFPFSTN